ncbi:MAG TPA: protein-disulfide reductase DsbD domain-containing protein, partial [Sphingomonadales bacterium]|nr:protein-disulfide reductase DsbD domain-containing protein [Sphingomonadales bacterium]
MKFLMPTVSAVAFFAASSFGQAATETSWASSPHAETRLIAGREAVPGTGEAVIVMGWQVRLEPGWKTYWRTPGEAGKPPRFSWEGSLNVASVRLLYPFPERFEIFGLHTYGYAGEVIYPLLVEPLIPGAPMTLKAKAEFLVCATLCVPAEQSYELSLRGTAGTAPPSRHYAHLAAALAKVPKDAGL